MLINSSSTFARPGPLEASSLRQLGSRSNASFLFVQLRCVNALDSALQQAE